MLDVARSDCRERILRRDAQRNRDLIILAARDVFAEHGVDASLEAVARRAGVAIGTVYRHFPTRIDSPRAST
ncbi:MULTISPECIES: helix-turn-helix domain-containing protein [unclassified Frankia]|uniref:helix-turn-helix domain-containing protein n=1 Tax=unclassified Frankia TaxID=2632575 RepID=UPI002AD1FD46|nr:MULTISPECIES: helix-turn-helix domain-containing protein [unclassified Frankia]